MSFGYGTKYYDADGRIQWRMYASLALNEFFWFGIG